jgi:serine/threonine protein phosphatase 1
MPGATVPSGFRVYAIGDIHGRLDLLGRLHQMILEDAQGAALDARILVYLGDYVDRGPESAGVIDLLSQQTLPGFSAIHLMGNHEDFMLRFLDDNSSGSGWFANGGVATMRSYGVDFDYGELLEPDRLQERLSRRVPSRHTSAHSSGWLRSPAAVSAMAGHDPRVTSVRIGKNGFTIGR